VKIRALSLSILLCSLLPVTRSLAQSAPPNEAVPLVTGKRIAPMGRQIEIGSFPVNMKVSPDGKYVIVTNSGYRQFLSVLSIADGKIVSQFEVNKEIEGGRPRKEGLYYGLDIRSNGDGTATIYASRGSQDKVQILTLNADGLLTDTERFLDNPSEFNTDGFSQNDIAGVKSSADGSIVYAVNNRTDSRTDMKGSLAVLDVKTNKRTKRIELPGFPFAIESLEKADRTLLYVTSERDGCVAVVDPAAGSIVKTIKTGMHPMALRFTKDKSRLYVANAGSDTISVVETATGDIKQTILLRPNDVRGLPGCTPTGMDFSPDERTLYVTLADMNAVAVVDVVGAKLLGYLPVGWYPTAIIVSPDGKKLFVSNAKGIASRNPNAVPAGLEGKNGRYIQNIIEGTLSVIPTPNLATLSQTTPHVVALNRITPTLNQDAKRLIDNPGIQHVIYIIKENRTYDQVLGDLPQGNGDKSLTLFGRDVTPNQHALAERFVLLDNFYCCAEVSADGWDWSTSGMISEYTARNAPYNYSGRGRNYDFEGQNNGVPVDLLGYPDVARAPSGYIWDLAHKNGVSFRNYGFYCNFIDAETRTKIGGKYSGTDNAPNKKVLEGKTDQNFRLYDLTYADSEAFQKLNIPSPYLRKKFGKNDSVSRFSEWKLEYEAYVQSKTMPKLMLVRLGNNHTRGTTPGAPSARAMVADNDFAVGQLVETVSRSPYWKSTAICILEDDAQNGFDHVDAHRSIAFVISPHIAKGTVDSTFYNTDSMLRTMELLLGLPPMCQYDAVATPIAVFKRDAANDVPYTAILPDKAIISEVNGKRAYRAEDSRRLISTTREDATPDDIMNDILWHGVKGRHIAKPPVRYGLKLSKESEEESEKRAERRSRKRK